MRRIHSVAVGAVDLRQDSAAAPIAFDAPAQTRFDIAAALDKLDHVLIVFARKAYPWVARGALFIVFFWFGIVKLFGVSEATGLARALTAKTVGEQHFHTLFNTLAVLECVIGVLCLIPRLTRLAVVMLLMHMAVVCAPLFLVPELTWQAVLVPTMDGQYIIKNVLVIAAAFGLAANAPPRAAPSGPDVAEQVWPRADRQAGRHSLATGHDVTRAHNVPKTRRTINAHAVAESPVSEVG
jgi:uncharacterized membrane protein YphA (DoxX/SURF4 family)